MLRTAGGRAATQSEFLPSPPTPPRFDAVPESLRAVRAWVVWAYGGERQRSGKYPKRPYNPRTDNPADATDEKTWGTFCDAGRAYHAANGGYDGIGFVFAPAGSHAGLDIDGCRDPQTGEVAAHAERLLADLNTYTEVSPSGSGVKAFAVGRIDQDGPNRSGAVEVYDRNRFFAVTGWRLDRFCGDTRPAGQTLKLLQDSFRPSAVERGRTPAKKTGRAVGAAGPEYRHADAHALLARMSGASNFPTIHRYYHGERQGKPSASEALLGLARLAAFWTGDDPVVLEAFLRTSRLWLDAEYERAKWESMRGSESWGMRYVVRKAIASCLAFHASVGYSSTYSLTPSHGTRGTRGTLRHTRHIFRFFISES